jgi:aminopeptidase N
MNKLALGLMVALVGVACSPTIKLKNQSYSNYEDVIFKHLTLNLTANFESKTLSGEAIIDIENKALADYIILDCRQLKIKETYVDGTKVNFEIGPTDSTFGAALSIPILPNSKLVRIVYSTTPQSAALQWLNKAQTNDKTDEFLFSQSQAILARTWIPLMDVPAVRFTYDATIKVPKHLLPLMSAVNPQKKNAEGIYHFKQEKPIPSYLMAIAIGNVEFKNIGRNSGVYAEPGMLEKSAWELADMQKMIDEAEKLYGPYVWNRYDVLVLPPSFPFGGMENPELTFATPTIIAGDRSLVSLIAHELAHSWSGNLVTNRTWDDFWLNEGFTVYFEQRIMEAVYGKEYEEMLTVNGYGELQNTLIDLQKTAPEDTKLKLDLGNRNPDDGLTDIAYEKGRFFLQTLERTVGREQWDIFLRRYFTSHAFQTMTTEEFLAYLNKELLDNNPQWKKDAMANDWIYEKGMPSNFIAPVSSAFKKLDSQLAIYAKSKNPSAFKTQEYSTHHWLYVLRHLPKMTTADVAKLDETFGFNKLQNSEILCDWFLISLDYKYQPSIQPMKDFSHRVGRRKFLTPLYKKIIATNGKDMARDIYKTAKKGYHTVAVETLDDLLK